MCFEFCFKSDVHNAFVLGVIVVQMLLCRELFLGGGVIKYVLPYYMLWVEIQGAIKQMSQHSKLKQIQAELLA